jgi:hypothetical protein
MAIAFTFDDPKAPTQPFTYKRVYMLHPDWKVTEYNCTDEDEGMTISIRRSWRPPENHRPEVQPVVQI